MPGPLSRGRAWLERQLSDGVSSAVIAQELGLPEYDDVSNAPQTQGRIVYATGAGASAEGIYKHDGTAYATTGAGLRDGDNFDGQGTSNFSNLNLVGYSPQDVRNISSPSQGYTAYHDGSGSNTEGPAHYNGTDWISTVDGSTIA